MDWTENRLNTLHITSKLSSLIPVNKIISNYLHATVTLGYFDGNPVATNLEKIVNSCIEMINIDSTPFKDIDVDDISDIKSSLAYSMIFSTPKCAPELSKPGNLRKINSWKQGDVEGMSKLKYWFYNKFYVHGQEFTEQLIRLCLCQENKKPIKEEMFEHLFRSFCSMFGLSSLKEANGETFKIGNTLVTAVPDIIFPNFKKFNTENQNNKLNIMAVCKIKRGFEENNLSSPTETRSQKQKSTKREKITKHIQHLNDKLLGQHGGELLVYLSQTQTNSMLGIVVNKTNVTFSYMQCKAEQLQKIQNGEYIEPMEITYSRCYNFLRAEDRKVLMKAFLSLGVTQLTPYV